MKERIFIHLDLGNYNGCIVKVRVESQRARNREYYYMGKSVVVSKKKCWLMLTKKVDGFGRGGTATCCDN
jgi:hypothetical protein